MPSTKIRLALGTESNAAARCFSVTFETYIYFGLYLARCLTFYIEKIFEFCLVFCFSGFRIIILN